jgi:hypothetical protein
MFWMPLSEHELRFLSLCFKFKTENIVFTGIVLYGRTLVAVERVCALQMSPKENFYLPISYLRPFRGKVRHSAHSMVYINCYIKLNKQSASEGQVHAMNIVFAAQQKLLTNEDKGANVLKCRIGWCLVLLSQTLAMAQ